MELTRSRTFFHEAEVIPELGVKDGWVHRHYRVQDVESGFQGLTLNPYLSGGWYVCEEVCV
jgi:hypothetical protein